MTRGLTVPLAAIAALAAAPSASAAPNDALFKLLPDDVAGSDHFGSSVAIRGATVVVGAHLDDLSPRIGYAYVFDASTGQPVHKLTATDGVVRDYFGCSVATDGPTAAVGALGDDDQGSDSGSAYVFDTATGQQIVKLLPFDGAATERFGTSVAVEGDRVLVGAPFDDEQGSWSGAAYFFDASSGLQLTKLRPAQVQPYEQFGTNVAMSGSTALVGSLTKVYVFDAATFELTGTLPIPGRAIAIDGSLVVVGSTYNHTATVFDLTTGQPITLLRPTDDSTNAYFGSAVGISGATVVVGAYRQDDDGPGGVPHTGSAYLFDVATGAQIAKLKPHDLSPGDDLGSSAAIFGSIAVVGAWRADAHGENTGAAYLFDTTQGLAVPYCFGAGGTPCPCGNSGEPGNGCGNAVFAHGARLVTIGSPEVDSDDLVLRTTSSTPNQTGMFFQGDATPGGGNGIPFGDGLLCVGGQVRRLQTRQTSPEGVAFSTIPIAATAGVAPGDTRHYQWWYRDLQSSPCGARFNLSNGITVIWAP